MASQPFLSIKPVFIGFSPFSGKAIPVLLVQDKSKNRKSMCRYFYFGPEKFYRRTYPGYDLNQLHPSLFTIRTTSRIKAGQTLDAFISGFGFYFSARFAVHCGSFCKTIAQNAEVSHFNKTFRQNVHAKSPQKLNAG